jgi:hypothetical protein
MHTIKIWMTIAVSTHVLPINGAVPVQCVALLCLTNNSYSSTPTVMTTPQS